MGWASARFLEEDSEILKPYSVSYIQTLFSGGDRRIRISRITAEGSATRSAATRSTDNSPKVLVDSLSVQQPTVPINA